jgi:hypothetical protein
MRLARNLSITWIDIGFWALMASCFFGVYQVVGPGPMWLGVIISTTSMLLLFALALNAITAEPMTDPKPPEDPTSPEGGKSDPSSGQS